jgi:hypothetical protein
MDTFRFLCLSVGFCSCYRFLSFVKLTWCSDQCAASLALGPPEDVTILANYEESSESLFLTDEPPIYDTKLLQRPYTTHKRYLHAAGSTPLKNALLSNVRSDQGSRGRVLAPDVVPYTQYMNNSVDLEVESEGQLALTSLPSDPIAMASGYGFLAVGFESGILCVFCMENPKM